MKIVAVLLVVVVAVITQSVAFAQYAVFNSYASSDCSGIQTFRTVVPQATCTPVPCTNGKITTCSATLPDFSASVYIAQYNNASCVGSPFTYIVYPANTCRFITNQYTLYNCSGYYACKGSDCNTNCTYTNYTARVCQVVGTNPQIYQCPTSPSTTTASPTTSKITTTTAKTTATTGGSFTTGTTTGNRTATTKGTTGTTGLNNGAYNVPSVILLIVSIVIVVITV